MIVYSLAARAVLRSVLVSTLLFCALPAPAAPWAEVGDAQLRSDIETLAAAGVIDNLTTEWPVPWTRIVDRLSVSGALAGQPQAVVDAAERIQHQAAGQMTQDTASFSAYFDATNAPEVVRGFDALGRQAFQTQGTLAWNGQSTFIQLAAGIQSHDHFDSQSLLLDGTYIAHQFGNVAAYAGFLTHWWGPGWISALSMSNNAHPIPQIGFSRINDTPSRYRYLAWMGPWQAEFFIGVLKGDGIPHNTLLDGLRFGFNPAPGLEIGLERMDESCGKGHPCNPTNYFNLSNSTTKPSKTNDQGDIDIKYSHKLGGIDLSAYLQVMNEDSNPFYHSATSHLIGLTGWLPVAQTRVRITAEFTDTIATQQIFSFGDYFYGFPYNDYKYPGGMRYRDQALGFSLDTNSKLETLQASWVGPHEVTWTLTFHHALIAAQPPVNAVIYSDVTYFVSTAAVPINIGEVRASFPLLDHFTVNAEARYATDQPRPAKGAQAAGELSLKYTF